MSVLEYDFNNRPGQHFTPPEGDELRDFLDIQKVLRPSWWDRLSLFHHGYNSLGEVLKNDWNRLISNNANNVRSVKTCPGLGEYFTRTANLLWPCDVLIETSKDGTWKYSCQSPEAITIIGHANEMKSSHLEKKIILKTVPNFWAKNKDFDIYFGEPLLYCEPEYRVSPGILKQSSKPIQLNTFLFFPKEDAKYVYHAGDPICSLTFSKRVNKVKRVDMKKETSRYTYELRKRLFNSKWSIRDRDE